MSRPRAQHRGPVCRRADRGAPVARPDTALQVPQPAVPVGTGPEPPSQWWTRPGRTDASVWSRVGADCAGSARVSNLLLGGKDSFRADRAVADRLREADPSWADTAKAARRSVLELAGRLAARGVGQFVDLGCGLTTSDHPHAPRALRPLHTAVLPAFPGARIVYADRDPMVLAHARALLHTQMPGRARHLMADLTSVGPLTEALLGPNAGLDRRQPVAVVLSDVLHELTDPQIAELLTALREGLPPGSRLVLSHRHAGSDEARRAAIATVHAEAGLAWHPRTRGDLEVLAAGWRTADLPSARDRAAHGYTVMLLETGGTR
ncbi:SAM-dependent methyltransferase [Kitasatospora sp. NPDC058046]|uniref:SAM-dependent methyltransferase n=1 Tax=Kitasatospora sp. NPDC058046 TaxID=3346312 RepID=UPI0036DA4AB0